ncbi:exodeoxyribonuclease V subunit alpha [Glaciecola punicea]|uniref:exodeoxyribonuclease V subunit alpha n=1 Tax=Glaciecola punicea TaxID=56804 RepID=UPI000871FED6|nr:exodeoxyribonuclease V subunit alpha [Glaciecola punicea]OFA31695.1 exodeoxyribonuclease V subunit alpha [Glaciecola punicea]
MSIFSEVKYVPYADSRDCMNALATIEAIDFFFARQILLSQQQIGSSLSPTQYQEVFHVLLALSQYQRRGSVCIYLSTLANVHMWQAASPDTEIEANDIDVQSGSNAHERQDAQGAVAGAPESFVRGFQFSGIDELHNMLALFTQGLRPNSYLVLEKSRLYSKRYWHYEHTLCRYIAASVQQATIDKQHGRLISQQMLVSETMGLLFATPVVSNNIPDLQQLAVLNSLALPLSIITGGAGTGKTYTITRLAILISIVNSVPIHAIEMVAPTGKAANRMAQSLTEELAKLTLVPQLADICQSFSQLQPKTLNRLLKTKPITGQSAYSAQRPLPVKLIIVDETSMIDISLMHKLIDSLSPGTQLILVGDPNQLPSVETGCLLADLVAHPFAHMPVQHWQSLCNIYPALRLAEDFAQQHLVTNHKAGRGVVNKLVGTRRSHQIVDSFANAILAGDAAHALNIAQVEQYASRTMPSALLNSVVTFEQSRGQVQILPLMSANTEQSNSLKYAVDKVIADHILPHLFNLFKANSPDEAFLALKKYALLTPFRKSYLGTASLNQLIELALSKHLNWIKPNQLYKCKPIMILQNDYQLSLFNGDIGIMWENSDKELVAYFTVDKHLVAYPVYNLPAFDTNFAMTIHKTQGSEFENVDIILPPSDSDFLNKQLLYTGVTRAQKSVRIFTSIQTFRQTISTSADRISGLDASLSAALACFGQQE